MGTCTTCGACVTPDLEWCGQCLRAVATLEPDPRVGPRMPLSPARGPVHEAVYSRWHGGPAWFGPFGRILMTLGVLMAVPGGYPMLRGLILATVGFDIPGRGSSCCGSRSLSPARSSSSRACGSAPASHDRATRVPLVRH